MIWDDVPFIFGHLQDTLQIALLFGRANVVMGQLNPPFSTVINNSQA